MGRTNDTGARVPHPEIVESLTEAEAIWLARWVLERTYRAVKTARDWDRLGVQMYEDFRLSPGGVEDDRTLRQLLDTVAARCTDVGEARRGRYVVSRHDVALYVARRDLARALKAETKGVPPSPDAVAARFAALRGAGLDVPPDQEHRVRDFVRPTGRGTPGPDLQALQIVDRVFGRARRVQDAAKAALRSRVGAELAATGSVQQILNVLDAQGGPDPAPIQALVEYAIVDILDQREVAEAVSELDLCSVYEPASPVPPPGRLPSDPEWDE